MSNSHILALAKNWHLIDATKQSYTHIAARAAELALGKHKPVFHPSKDCGDHVVIINTAKIAMPEKEWTDKYYRHHTGFPGGLNEMKACIYHAKSPSFMLRRSIFGLLPTKDYHLRLERISNVHVYDGDEISAEHKEMLEGIAIHPSIEKSGIMNPLLFRKAY